jgi:hypothetical protein
VVVVGFAVGAALGGDAAAVAGAAPYCCLHAASHASYETASLS